MKDTVEETRLIERPDGSTIPYDKLPPEKQIEHDAATRLFGMALELHEELAKFKKLALAEMFAARDMMFQKYEVKKGGENGGMSMRSVCGRYLVRVSVSKTTRFGDELNAAKKLIFEVVEDELVKGASPFLKNLVTRIFSLNEKGRIDTHGILNLRNEKNEDPRWLRAMQAIEQAIIKDNAQTYVNFYRIDTAAADPSQAEQRIPLDLAKV